MPYYNFKCLDCESVTEIKASWQEKAAGLTVSCKTCQSANTTHVFGNIGLTAKATIPLAACGMPKEQAQAGGCGGSCACH